MQVNKEDQAIYTGENPTGPNKNWEMTAYPFTIETPNPIEMKIKMKSLFLIKIKNDFLKLSFSPSAVKLGGMDGLFFQNKKFNTEAPA